MKLRDYQVDAVNNVREALRNNDRVCLMLPTGAGKTVAFIDMVHKALARENDSWIIVPLKELIRQTSNQLTKRGISHGLITANHEESPAYKVHVVSKSTLTRRWNGKIKKWPKIIIIDEAHQNYKFQIDLLEKAPPGTKIIGITATPERLSGEGLSDIYQVLIPGPSIKDLIDMGYLSQLVLYAPPLEGLEGLSRRGTEYNAKELQALFKNRAIYAKVIDTYRELVDGKPTLVFCRDVASAEQWAATFNAAGYRAANIDGSMNDARRREIFDAMENGELDVITSVELITCGYDCPKIECVIKLRPTLSKALNSQMDGRGFRIYPGKKTLYSLDFVNNIATHGHPLGDYEWNFHGKKKRKKKGKSAAIMNLCGKCFIYFTEDVCPKCKIPRDVKKFAGLVELDGRLEKQEGPIAVADRTPEERAAYMGSVSAIKAKYREAVARCLPSRDAVSELCALAKDAGRHIMWVYHELNNSRKINDELLLAIRDANGYHEKWVQYQRTSLLKRV